MTVARQEVNKVLRAMQPKTAPVSCTLNATGLRDDASGLLLVGELGSTLNLALCRSHARATSRRVLPPHGLARSST